MRVIFYTFLSILGISLSVIILMPSLFDINNYKRKIESLVYSKTGNTLKIKGNINVTLLTGLKLSVKDISFISSPFLAIICKPIGLPVSLNPIGTVKVGKSNKLEMINTSNHL